MIVNAESLARGLACWSANRFSSAIDQVMNDAVSPGAGFCLQPTHSLTFLQRGFDMADQFSIIL